MKEKIQTKEAIRGSDRIIIFVGPEGSGKTTISKQLAAEIGKPYLTTGDVLRDLAKNDFGVWGDKCRAMFEKHEYLDGETLLEIMVDRFGREDTVHGFVLDGGLRTIEETVKFKEMLAAAGRDLPVTVVHLRIPGWMSMERLVTGENARKRGDDTVEGVMGRLSKYYTKLAERSSAIYYQENWNMVHIDATLPVESVYQAVYEAVSDNFSLE